MSGYSIKRIDEMESVARGTFRKARAELGVTSFGIQVIDFPPNADRYPEHDHAHDGQEEVYLALSGTGEIEVDGERVALDTESIVRVDPGAKRKVYAGPDGMRLLALGGTPGSPYEVKEFTELGQPDPFASL